MSSPDIIASLFNYDPATGRFTWSTTRSSQAIAGREFGSWDLHGYKTVRIMNRSYKLHRLAWLATYGKWPDGDIDHMNGVRHDNRLCNLRDVPRRTNLENRRKANPGKPSGLPLGVHACQRSTNYEARISVGNTTIRLGQYASIERASDAYFRAKAKLHKGFITPEMLETP